VPVFLHILLAIALLSPLAAATPSVIAQTGASAPQDPASSQTAAPLAEPVANAEADLLKSDWKSAEAALAPYLAAHPSDARALFDAGYVADAQNHTEEAIGFYRRAVESNPQSLQAHLSLGLLLARQGKFEEARPELLAATTLDPGELGPDLKARAFRALARIDAKTDPADASQDLLEALKLTPETAEDTLLAANLADASGEPETAEAAYRRVLTKDPKSAPANAGLAHLLIARKNYAEAETFLRAALEQSPDDLALSAQLATVLAAQDKAEALPLLQKLHADHPKEASITRMLAQVLAEAGDFAGSDQFFVLLLAATPDDAFLLAAHGQNLLRQLKNPEAFKAFDKATQLDPANADAWSGLAFAASKTGQPSIAIHALTMRSQYLPEGPSTYFLWAISYDALHDKASAATYYQHFLDSAAGKFPDQEWQARQRLILLRK
jgi:predicted Zn-dependent protease